MAGEAISGTRNGGGPWRSASSSSVAPDGSTTSCAATCGMASSREWLEARLHHRSWAGAPGDLVAEPRETKPLAPTPYPADPAECAGQGHRQPMPGPGVRDRGTVDRRELVERAGRGDHDAFAVLVTASATRLDAAARLILRDPELARDAVQNAMVRAWRDLPGLRDPDKFDAWLHRLLVNSCLDEARRRRRRPIEVEIDPIHEPVATADTARTSRTATWSSGPSLASTRSTGRSSSSTTTSATRCPKPRPRSGSPSRRRSRGSTGRCRACAGR